MCILQFEHKYFSEMTCFFLSNTTRPNFTKIEWLDFDEFVDSNLTEYGRPSFAIQNIDSKGAFSCHVVIMSKLYILCSE